MRVLITGVTGFAGSHLAEYLLNRGGAVEIHGTRRPGSALDNIDHLQGRITLHDCDIRDEAAVQRTIGLVRPDRIFHLAAHSSPHASWSTPGENLFINVLGQLHILEAVRALRLSPSILIAGSSEEYGLAHPEELPIRENNPMRPLSPYAVSKVTQDMMGFQYFMNYQLRIVRTRGFNHTGPRRGETYSESNFAQQIARIEAGQHEPVIHVGNLEARRDFTDVRDTVRGYWLALEKGAPGEAYNVCTGRALAIREILEMLLGMSHIKVQIRKDPVRLRPSDPPMLYGDPSKFSQATGWKPEFSMEKTLRDLLDYWRQRVAAQSQRLR